MWGLLAIVGSAYCLTKAFELMARPGAAGVAFGLLFLVVPVWLIQVAAMRSGGRVEVVKEGPEGRFFGVGRVGWTCRFRWQDVREVQNLVTPARPKQAERRVIWVDLGNGKVVTFGSLLDEVKRAYLIEAIREGMRG